MKKFSLTFYNYFTVSEFQNHNEQKIRLKIAFMVIYWWKWNNTADVLTFLLSLFEVLYTHIVIAHTDFFVFIPRPLKYVPLHSWSHSRLSTYLDPTYSPEGWYCAKNNQSLFSYSSVYNKWTSKKLITGCTVTYMVATKNEQKKKTPTKTKDWNKGPCIGISTGKT